LLRRRIGKSLNLANLYKSPEIGGDLWRFVAIDWPIHSNPLP
jgi:hypothetical protein